MPPEQDWRDRRHKFFMLLPHCAVLYQNSAKIRKYYKKFRAPCYLHELQTRDSHNNWQAGSLIDQDQYSYQMLWRVHNLPLTTCFAWLCFGRLPKMLPKSGLSKKVVFHWMYFEHWPIEGRLLKVSLPRQVGLPKQVSLKTGFTVLSQYIKFHDTGI